jgi:hypothetical protein
VWRGGSDIPRVAHRARRRTAEQALNREQNRPHIVHRRPFLLQREGGGRIGQKKDGSTACPHGESIGACSLGPHSRQPRFAASLTSSWRATCAARAGRKGRPARKHMHGVLGRGARAQGGRGATGDGRSSDLENVEADVAVLVDVGMEAWCGGMEGDLRGLVRVARRELERQLVGDPLVHLCSRGNRGACELRGKRARPRGPAWRLSCGTWVGARMRIGSAAAPRTVPDPPVIVPVHWKMLSPSGNAESPASALIMSDMSSDCSLRGGGCGRG